MSTTANIEASNPARPPLLSVQDLAVHFATADGLVKSVDGLSFDVEAGRTLAIVGESGSGKSVTGGAIMGLHRGTRARVSGSITFDGVDVLTLPARELRRLRGNEISLIFQDPLSALHPYFTVGSQLVEAYRLHHSASKAEARRRSIEMLELVGIPSPQRRIDEYPHQYSGGMRQRAVIAMALINGPRLIIADEPTTALDVTVQAQILALLRNVQKQFDSSIIIITHDLGVVAEIADDVLVMYAGKAVECGSVQDLFYRPEMPYTWGLLGSMPRAERGRGERLVTIPGSPPSLIRPPSGCAFHTRCEYRHLVEGRSCVDDVPQLEAAHDQHLVRCHIPHALRLDASRSGLVAGP